MWIWPWSVVRQCRHNLCSQGSGNECNEGDVSAQTGMKRLQQVVGKTGSKVPHAWGNCMQECCAPLEAGKGSVKPLCHLRCHSVATGDYPHRHCMNAGQHTTATKEEKLKTQPVGLVNVWVLAKRLTGRLHTTVSACKTAHSSLSAWTVGHRWGGIVQSPAGRRVGRPHGPRSNTEVPRAGLDERGGMMASQNDGSVKMKAMAIVCESLGCGWHRTDDGGREVQQVPSG